MDAVHVRHKLFYNTVHCSLLHDKKNKICVLMIFITKIEVKQK